MVGIISGESWLSFIVVQLVRWKVLFDVFTANFALFHPAEDDDEEELDEEDDDDEDEDDDDEEDEDDEDDEEDDELDDEDPEEDEVPFSDVVSDGSSVISS